MYEQIYNEALCEKTIQILSTGKSIAALAHLLGVCRETIYEWRDKHPEYARALKKGRDACQLYWEDIGQEGIQGDIKNFSATAWMFTMKNRFRDDYKEDKQEKTISESIVEKLIDRLVDN
jgi:transposase-like protein